MSHFVFLINRLLSKVFYNKTTPFGILQNKTLDLSILKVFGYEYFVSTLLAQITKSDPRAKKRVYLKSNLENQEMLSFMKIDFLLCNLVMLMIIISIPLC